MNFRLADRTDLADLREAFARDRRVEVRCFLPDDDAERLAAALLESQAWLQIFRAEDKVYEMPDAAFRALSSEQRERLEALVFEEARKGLQYRYRSIRSPDPGEAGSGAEPLLDSFAAFINSAEVLELMRAITGDELISKCDAQATLYEAGSFLTTHDDDVEGKHRSAAYVFGLTRVWQADWGGLLLLDEADEVHGFVPAFNSLRIFAVPQSHHVSAVAPWVERGRLSITGWLRRNR